jgi:hypothetical protein
MLIDTREHPPEPEPDGDRGEPWPLALLSWVLPWPALIVWLFVFGEVLDGWAGQACMLISLGLCVWRLSLPFRTVGGMREYKQ